MLLRILIFSSIAILIALPLTLLTLRRVGRLHPKLKRFFTVIAVAGNSLWLVLPFIVRAESAAWSRITRAVIAPIWLYWTLLILIYAIFTFIVFLAWLPWMKRIDADRFARFPSAVALLIIAVGSVIGFWQALVPLRIEHVSVAVAGQRTLRIAQMSDLHVGLFTRRSRLQQIVRAAMNEEVDAIVLTGDMIDDDPYYVPKLVESFRDLPVPVYAVLGNHEMYGDPDAAIAQFRTSPIRLLVNEGVRLGPTGDDRSLWLAGLSDFAADQLPERRALRPNIDSALAGRTASDAVVLLAHQPKAFALAKRLQIPLTIVGHSHGGQFGIRSIGWSMAGVFLRYHMGLYREGSSTMYVNTGTGHWVLPFRLGMTPEITIYEVGY